MTEHESPIEVAFDISRIYKERLADVASFQFRNRADEHFHLVVNLRSRIFSRAIEVDFRLGPAEVRTHRFTLELPSRETCPRGQGSSGRHPIQIAISISDDEAPTRDRHSFSGEWMTMVLERDASRQTIVNHAQTNFVGDKAGTGAIAEIIFPPVKTPESTNELLERLNKLPEKFELVPLSYEGVVDASSGDMPQPQPHGKPRSATDLVDLESRGRILQREAKAALDDGEPLPSEYRAKFERAGHFVDSAKENKSARLWSDAAAVLELACGLYEEIRATRGSYDALRESQAKIEAIDGTLNKNSAGLELDDLPQAQAYRVKRDELDRRIEESVGAFDWPAACETANAIIDLSSEHRKWVWSLQKVREETLHVRSEVNRIDGELISLGAELSLDADPKSLAYRSNRIELDDRLHSEMKSLAWSEARDAAGDQLTLAKDHRSHLQQMRAIHQRVESLLEKNKASGERLAAIDLQVDLSMVPEVQEFLSERGELEEGLEEKVQTGEWWGAESSLSELCELLETQVAWATRVASDHQKCLELRKKIDAVDADTKKITVEMGPEFELDGHSRLKEFRSERSRLDGVLSSQIQAGDWVAVLSTSDSIHVLVKEHRSWVQSASKVREKYLKLRKQIDAVDADTKKITVEMGPEFELGSRSRFEKFRLERSRLDGVLSSQIEAGDWVAVLSTSDSIHVLVKEHRSWVRSTFRVHEKYLKLRKQIDAIDADTKEITVEMGPEIELGGRSRFEKFRSERSRLDGVLSSQIEAGDWVAVLTTSDSIHVLVKEHRSWERRTRKVRQQYLRLRREIDAGVADTTRTFIEVGSGFEVTASLRDNLARQSQSTDQVDSHVAALAWEDARAAARVRADARDLLKLVLANRKQMFSETKAYQRSVARQSPAARRQRRLVKLAVLGGSLVAMVMFVFWWLSPVLARSVGAGGNITFAVLADGSVACWGDNDSGQCAVPSGVGTLSNPVASVAAGYYHTVALRWNGSVACWGDNDSGQCDVPSGVGTAANPVASVAAGFYHTVALRLNGSVACWGSNGNDQCDVPSGVGTAANPVASVAAGNYHTVALLLDGSVACWGRNGSGQCDVPSGVGTPTNPVASVAAGYDHTVALLLDGSVACWGWNGSGQCDVPSGVGTAANPVASVAAGSNHTVALLADGSVACWGSNDRSQCNVPSGVGTPANPAVSVAAGSFHTVVVLSDGSFTCWGANDFGQCDVRRLKVENAADFLVAANDHRDAMASEAARLEVARLEAGRLEAARLEAARLEAARLEAARLEAARLEAARLEAARLEASIIQQSVSAGVYHTVALLADGSVACWGSNSNGSCDVPGGVGTLGNVAAGVYHTVALRSDGSVVCWGSNMGGQCDVPSDVGTAANPVASVAAGFYHTVALLLDGSVACWGDNNFGQCDVPRGVGTPANPVASVAAGNYYTVALLSDGSVACWGSNDSGQCDVPSGVGTPANPVASVAAGYDHTVALLADGSIACWGSNDDGQCAVPRGVGTAANPVTSVAAGYDHTVALLADGSVTCWGLNDFGQCDVPSGVGTPANPVVSVAAGSFHTVVVLSDGSFTCWGANELGQCSPPAGLRVRLPE